MYITELELENFKIHRNLKLNFSNVTAILGKNAKGKTSILDAISYALYGVTGDGATKKELLTNPSYIGMGETPPKNGKVKIKFDNGFSIVRDITSTSVALYNEENKKVTDKSTEIETWLNIPKEMFMNLIYGVQGKMTETFLKFNATQKDFLDSIFNIDNYVEPISNKLTETLNIINYEYSQLQNRKNNKISAEEYIVNTLKSLNCETINDLKTKIENMENQLKLFSNVEEIDKLKKTQIEYSSKLNYVKSSINTLGEDIKSYDVKLKDTKEKLIEASSNLSSVLNFKIDENTTRFDIQNHIKNLCDINLWYGNLEKILNEINENNVNEYKISALEILKFLRQIDVCKNSYNELLSFWENLRNNIENYKNFIENGNVKIKNFYNDMGKLNESLNNITSKLDNFGAADASQTNLDIYKKLVYDISNLKATYSSLIEYQNQINNLVFDEKSFEVLEDKRNKLSKVLEIFKREGFPKFLRNAYIKDVAAMMNDMLLNFGFESLLPVTVTESGEFLYRGVKTKSISGAQKICTSIIQKFIYGRILAPGMKLGVMILDEPTYGLDNSRIDYLKDFLNILNKTLGLQLIIVTHNSGIIPDDATLIEL